MTVFNSLVYSLVQYVNSNLVTPPRVLSETRNIATSFLWTGKRSKAAYNTVIQTASDGGLCLMDLEYRTHINHLAWIKCIVKNPESTAAEMIRIIAGERNVQFALGLRSPISGQKSLISPFYHAVIKTWEKVHTCQPESEEDVRAEVLWDNGHISSPKRMLSRDTWKHWIDAGILTIQHVCHSSESRIMDHNKKRKSTISSVTSWKLSQLA